MLCIPLSVLRLRSLPCLSGEGCIGQINGYQRADTLLLHSNAVQTICHLHRTAAAAAVDAVVVVMAAVAAVLAAVAAAVVVAVVAMVAVAVLMADAVDAISPYTLMPLPV